jgi:hypothetical protein
VGGLGREYSRVALLDRLRESLVQEDRLVIPDPFRLTPLQLNSDVPICTECLNWPSIWDQLVLLQMDDGDLALLMRDIVMNIVIDFPSWNASVNIYDLFHNKISPGSLMRDSLGSPEDMGYDEYDNLSESQAAMDSELTEQRFQREKISAWVVLSHRRCMAIVTVWGLPPNMPRVRQATPQPASWVLWC